VAPQFNTAGVAGIPPLCSLLIGKVFRARRLVSLLPLAYCAPQPFFLCFPLSLCLCGGRILGSRVDRVPPAFLARLASYFRKDLARSVMKFPFFQLCLFPKGFVPFHFSCINPLSTLSNFSQFAPESFAISLPRTSFPAGPSAGWTVILKRSFQQSPTPWLFSDCFGSSFPLFRRPSSPGFCPNQFLPPILDLFGPQSLLTYFRSTPEFVQLCLSLGFEGGLPLLAPHLGFSGFPKFLGAIVSRLTLVPVWCSRAVCVPTGDLSPSVCTLLFSQTFFLRVQHRARCIGRE